MKSKNHALDKSAEAIQGRADGVFELAKAHHAQADDQHTTAAKQLDNAERQKAIAEEQLREAAKLEAKAVKLDALGDTLLADAIEIKGGTQVN
jgi:predicted ribosome quality control (RQC) complex YloA/Tae2 family protein